MVRLCWHATQKELLLCSDQPIAAPVGNIGAKTISHARVCWSDEAIAILLKRRHRRLVRQITDRTSTAVAHDVFEVERPSARFALKELHIGSGCASGQESNHVFKWNSF
jgi:hypothetical protein